jgi:hypothetical protein
VEIQIRGLRDMRERSAGTLGEVIISGREERYTPCFAPRLGCGRRAD